MGKVGQFCAIAGNVVIGQFQQPTQFLSVYPLFDGEFEAYWPHSVEITIFHCDNGRLIEKAKQAWKSLVHECYGRITIGNDVWIGEGVTIMMGITIGDGAVIAARSVATKNVPPYAVVGSAPATVKKMRFSEKTCATLCSLQWWKY